MRYVLIIITSLILTIGGCGENFKEKTITPTPTELPIPVHAKLPEGWKIQRNEKDEYRLIKPNDNVLEFWGYSDGSKYHNMQNAIDSAWEYIEWHQMVNR